MTKVAKYIILGIFLYVSCTKDALFDAGPEKTKAISLHDFSVIEAENTFEVELVTDTVNQVYITCGENLFKFINIDVFDGTLYLKHNISQTWSRNYKKVRLELHTKPFQQINIRKPIKLYNHSAYVGGSFSLVDWGKFSEVDMEVDVDYCLIAMSSDNFGQFNIKGKATDADIWGWGSCLTNADSLITTNCNVTQRGMGDVYVNVKSRLTVTIDFTGNVYYSGRPQEVILQSKKGSGNLYQK
jgi:hypothetical protein